VIEDHEVREAKLAHRGTNVWIPFDVWSVTVNVPSTNAGIPNIGARIPTRKGSID